MVLFLDLTSSIYQMQGFGGSNSGKPVCLCLRLLFSFICSPLPQVTYKVGCWPCRAGSSPSRCVTLVSHPSLKGGLGSSLVVGLKVDCLC